MDSRDCQLVIRYVFNKTLESRLMLCLALKPLRKLRGRESVCFIFVIMWYHCAFSLSLSENVFIWIFLRILSVFCVYPSFGYMKTMVRKKWISFKLCFGSVFLSCLFTNTFVYGEYIDYFYCDICVECVIVFHILYG